MERRFERADTAYPPSGRSWREELELENGGQIPLLFLLYFVANNTRQPLLSCFSCTLWLKTKISHKEQ